MSTQYDNRMREMDGRNDDNDEMPIQYQANVSFMYETLLRLTGEFF